MEKKEKDKDNAPAGIGDKMLEKTAATYKWWNRLATLNADDPIWLGALKIGVRIIGILIFLALSPLMLLGLIIGISAAL